MKSQYQAKDGTQKEFNLYNVIDVVGGQSGIKPNWSSLVCYSPTIGSFIELRDSPQDARGNCQSEAEEVSENYIVSTYSISTELISSFLNKPNKWQFIDNR
jgi:hypothetical protein